MLSVIILSVVASFDDRKMFILNDPKGKLVSFYCQSFSLALKMSLAHYIFF